MAEKIFSTIPMRTWRWLGVNEAKIDISPEPQEESTHMLSVPAGEKRDLTVLARETGQRNIKVKVEKGGTLQLIAAQLLPEEEIFTGSIDVILEKDARLEATIVEAGGEKSLSKVHVDLQGDNAQADVYVLYFGDKSSKLDMNYVLVQQGRNTQANLQVYGAMLGQAEKIFRGTLDFRQGSKGSKGYEKEHTVVLSGKVRNRSVPLMLSAEDAVEGHHAVSIGKIDEGKLFYLMSRGLDVTEARKLIVEAAFRPVLDRISDGALQQEIDVYIKERLSDV